VTARRRIVLIGDGPARTRAELLGDVVAVVHSDVLDASGPAGADPGLTVRAVAADADLVVVDGHADPATLERLATHCERPVLAVRAAPRGPYRRVLVGIDHTPTALDALAAASGLAPTAELVALHVATPVGERKLRAALVPERHVRALRRAIRDEELGRLRSFLAGRSDPERPVEPIAVAGVAADGIVATARRRHADLVVVGARGGGLRHALLGSVARSVLVRIPGDVLVVGGGAATGPEV